MTENALPKAIVLAAGVLAIAIAGSHQGSAGFVWTLLSVGAAGYVCWREFWQGGLSLPANDDEDDPVADRFR